MFGTHMPLLVRHNKNIIFLASFHSTGFFCVCFFLYLKKKNAVCFIDSSRPSIMTSLFRLSMPGALLFFISFRVVFTSDIMIGGASDESGLVFFS